MRDYKSYRAQTIEELASWLSSKPHYKIVYVDNEGLDGYVVLIEMFEEQQDG